MNERLKKEQQSAQKNQIMQQSPHTKKESTNTYSFSKKLFLYTLMIFSRKKRINATNHESS